MTNLVQDNIRLVITSDAGNGDEVQFTKSQEGGLHIEIDEPWAGSTETGFGATTSIYLKPEYRAALIAWLRQS